MVGSSAACPGRACPLPRATPAPDAGAARRAQTPLPVSAARSYFDFSVTMSVAASDVSEFAIAGAPGMYDHHVCEARSSFQIDTTVND